MANPTTSPKAPAADSFRMGKEETWKTRMTNINGAAATFSQQLQHAIDQLESLQLPHGDETADRCSPIDRQTKTQISSDSDDDRDRYSDRRSNGSSYGDDDSDDDDDLIARGPANSRSISLHRSQPYQKYLQPQPQHSLENENESVQLLIQEVLDNPVFKEVLNNCLDQLQHTQTDASRKDVAGPIGPGPGIHLSDNLSLLKSVQSGTFQAAQQIPEESSSRDPYLLGGNAILSESESQRTDYSPTRSPRENAYRGSRYAFPQIDFSSYSSLDSPARCQVSATATYRAAPNYFSSPSCSPCSSNQSYADASTPTSLHQLPVDRCQASEPVDSYNRNDLSLNFGQLLNNAAERPIEFNASSSPRATAAAMASSVSDNGATRRPGESKRNQVDSSAIAREPDRTVILRPYTNLPSVRVNEKLMQRLSSAEMEKAMSALLKLSDQDLAMQDEDGDTPLMRLVGNPDELERKMAYLVPLVERLSRVPGTLTARNTRGEDALYLAALNSNKFPFVAAYLITIMLDNGIDVAQRLYHTRGKTLLHLVAAQGDSHKQMLAELLALQVFDLQKTTYDGRTALHVAVESREPLETVKLLLDHGADPSAKEKVCDSTALHLAISSRSDPRLVKLLLDGRADELVNATNCNGDTPLHVAAAITDLPFEKQKEICLQLTCAGSNTNLRNLAGKTPLDLVTSTRKKVIQRIFSEKHVATLKFFL